MRCCLALRCQTARSAPRDQTELQAVNWQPSTRLRAPQVAALDLAPRQGSEPPFSLLPGAEQLDQESALGADAAPVAGECRALEKIRLDGEQVEACHVAFRVAAGEKKRFAGHAGRIASRDSAVQR